MQESQKYKIVIASVLKPIDDTRMFEKIGLTLATDGHEVHIIGFPAKITPTHATIQFHALPAFQRLSFTRLLAGYTIHKKWLSLKPQILIISTHELLWFALLTKLLRKTKIIYDVRENYYYNIRYTQTFPGLLRLPIAWYVRLKELVANKFFDYFFLAERAYVHELAFLPERKAVLENKFRKSLIVETNKRSGYSNLLFTGTLASTTGVFETIELVKKIYTVNSSISLTIVGYAAQTSVLKKIQDTIANYSYIKLIGGSALIPHKQVIEYILKADYGIIWYPLNKSTHGSMPTKLYEYAALGLRILSPANQNFTEYIQKSNIGVLFDVGESAETILAKLQNNIIAASPHDVYWENEEELLLHVINNL